MKIKNIEFQTLESCLKLFRSIDEAIIAAYDYVKNTGSKVQILRDHDGDFIGFEAEGYLQFVCRYTSLYVNKRELYVQIFNSKISLEDFINKQLMTFI